MAKEFKNKNNIPQKNVEALKKINKIFSDKKIDWILKGSMALAIRGINVEVHDIDIFINKKDIEKIPPIFDSNTKRTLEYVQTDALNIRSLWGTYIFDEAEIDIVSEVEHKINGKWKRINIKKTTKVVFEGMKFKILDLEEEYDGYLALGRTEKAITILNHINK
jgi:hypothetical protein